jgi:DNA (cytosine-5)-methyltransferase 1
MRFADFFAGIGLAAMGLERAGWRCVFANDSDPRKQAMFAANFDASRYLVKDVHDLRGDQVPEIQLAWASFPCTDLSLAGEREGLNGKESGTLWGFLRVLEEMRRIGKAPRLIVLENVVGWLTSHKGADFRAAIAALNVGGYRCDVLVIDAVHFVPQSRPRLFVVGLRGESTSMEPLARWGAFEPNAIRPKAVVEYMAAHPQLNWGLIPLPTPPSRAQSLGELLEDVPEGSPYWWSQERVTRLLSQMSRRHRLTVEEAMRGKRTKMATVYRRVRPTGAMAEVRGDGIAGCLRTPRGGSSRQIVLFMGHGAIRIRFMTPREYARLQGVSDAYRITVSDGQALFGFGDAVCVPAVEWLARHALNPLAAETMMARRRVAEVAAG